MSAHTRKHPIKEASCIISRQADEEKSVSWREAFQKGIEHFSEIGLMLKGGVIKQVLLKKLSPIRSP